MNTLPLALLLHPRNYKQFETMSAPANASELRSRMSSVSSGIHIPPPTRSRNNSTGSMHSNEKSRDTKGITDGQVWTTSKIIFRNPLFVACLVGCFLRALGQDIPSVYLPSKAKHWGITANQTSLIISMMGVCDTIGRLVSGLLTRYLSCLIIFLGVDILSAVLFVWGYVATEFVSMLLYAVITDFPISKWRLL